MYVYSLAKENFIRKVIIHTIKTKYKPFSSLSQSKTENLDGHLILSEGCNQLICWFALAARVNLKRKTQRFRGGKVKDQLHQANHSCGFF